ncbi:hypothetical protein AC792_07715 [Arthrobacter sp. RIT-PI-e]|uniref:hypothetical protein n=1 Tax=Arthrobacter sp. RIT-PI-e TaxID=1681197 RepID=UPI0006760F4E|nr:hypothetical protein [Arthrobacter sp. RIT-PI-e]KNC19213.1 hypothetical protein AC792_07715 [Arthrobacter sp. RIT-PI-e]
MEYLAVLLPSICLAVLFYFVIRTIFNADRSERRAMAEAERAQDEADARLRRDAEEREAETRTDPQ